MNLGRQYFLTLYIQLDFLGVDFTTGRIICQHRVYFGVSKRGEAPLKKHFPLPLEGKGDKGGWGEQILSM